MKKTWNIRRLVDDSFVPANQRTSVLYCRLSDFKPIIANFQNVMSCGSPSSIYSWFITFYTQDWNLSGRYNISKTILIFFASQKLFRNTFSSLLPSTAQTAQTKEFMFQNVYQLYMKLGWLSSLLPIFFSCQKVTFFLPIPKVEQTFVKTVKCFTVFPHGYILFKLP